MEKKITTISDCQDISISQIHANSSNPYKFREDEMETLQESIAEHGIMTPLLVRKDGSADIYEIISGHRRFLAAGRLGIESLPVRVLDVSKDVGDVMLVDSNLHREHILPSEKAKAYKLKMEALSHQGKATSRQLVGKSETADELSETESGRQVQRYIRLTHLIPELLQMVDEEKIALTPAVELSYLTEEEQKWLLETIETEEATPSLSQAKQLKNLSQAKILDMDQMLSVMVKPKANQKEVIKIKTEKYDRYFSGLSSPKEKEDFIARALDYYCKYLNRKKDRGDR